MRNIGAISVFYYVYQGSLRQQICQIMTRVLGDRAELQTKVLKNDWNEVHSIARGNLLQHFTNGVLISEVHGDDAEKRRLSGLLGVQVHVARR